MPRPAVVTTTIYVPKALDGYFENAVKHGHKDTLFVLTGDKKTPPEARDFLAEASKKHGVECIYMDCADQEAWLEKLPELKAHLPWNCIQRRNISLLVAYEKGCDPIITIDDDNFIYGDQDFVGDHIKPLVEGGAHEELKSATGWLNICDFLQDKRGYEFYARGYPMKQRWPEYPPIIKSAQTEKRVVCNAGLWLDDPDLDAITRLTNDICALRYTREQSFVLANGTWSPFNSQNTAFARDMLEAYWLSPVVGRYDDIWASYIIDRIADHLGHVVCYGFPLVKQERNPHNYFVDHQKEEDGLELTDRFCEMLRGFTITGSSYYECYKCLLPQLRAAIEALTDADVKPKKKEFLLGFIESNEVYLATITRLRGV